MKSILIIALAVWLVGCKESKKSELEFQMDLINDSASKTLLSPFEMLVLKNVVKEKP